jgi:hypothetical protein
VVLCREQPCDNPINDSACETALCCSMPSRASPPSCTLLSAGQAFVGTQNVSHNASLKDEAWKVHVRIQGCDLRHGTLCGSMEALNVPSAESSVVTFWEVRGWYVLKCHLAGKRVTTHPCACAKCAIQCVCVIDEQESLCQHLVYG